MLVYILRACWLGQANKFTVKVFACEGTSVVSALVLLQLSVCVCGAFVCVLDYLEPLSGLGSNSISFSPSSARLIDCSFYYCLAVPFTEEWGGS